MKLSFRRRLFLYFALLFAVFTAGIALFEQSRERIIRTEGLEEKLDIYANFIQSILSTKGEYKDAIKQLNTTLPPELRITIIDLQGTVLYDNKIDEYSKLECHASRSEIIEAEKTGKGTAIRNSDSTKHPYLYYAKKFGEIYVRVALPYNLQLEQFLKPDNLFLYFLLILFMVSLFFIHKITQQFGNSVKRLRDFTLRPDNSDISFGEDELGEIGKKISDSYRQLEDNKKKLSLEKNKLLQHIHISEEGICFVSSTQQVELYNGLFIRYLNQLTQEPKSNPAAILEDDAFAVLHQFLQQAEERYLETQIEKHGKIFSMRTNIFEDQSFEIILTDITRREKAKKLKQEMTGNIAHELRTPVTSVRAYLETVLEQSLPEERKEHFIRQAYHQTLTLSEMIKDMGIIAKMEEAPDSFTLEKINLPQLLNDLKTEQCGNFARNHIQMDWQLPEKLIITGNLNLLTSIFRNLIENSVRYAGEHIRINTALIDEDSDFYYFSFYDTGKGVAKEAHLNRIFERFYRVQEGRTRDTGGSGLGLSIVKNAIHFHKGSICAKNRKGGGLEFLFHLRK